MFTDTHCHLNAPELRFRLPELFSQAKQQQISGFIVPATDCDSWQTILSLWLGQPEIRIAALGIHPWFIAGHSDDVLIQLAEWLTQYPALWLGEIGLDSIHAHRQPEQNLSCQSKWFEAQLSLAQQFARPIILHNVKATQLIINSCKRTRFTQGGIAHAFSGSLEEAQLLIKHGFKIGLGSLLLRQQAKKVRELAKILPVNSILLETDSPYMLPENSNTPCNLLLIAQEVARLREISLLQLAQICEKNLQDLLVNRLQNNISQG